MFALHFLSERDIRKRIRKKTRKKGEGLKMMGLKIVRKWRESERRKGI